MIHIMSNGCRTAYYKEKTDVLLGDDSIPEVDDQHTVLRETFEACPFVCQKERLGTIQTTVPMEVKQAGPLASSNASKYGTKEPQNFKDNFLSAKFFIENVTELKISSYENTPWKCSLTPEAFWSNDRETTIPR